MRKKTVEMRDYFEIKDIMNEKGRKTEEN